MDNTKDDRYYIRKIIENIDVILHNTEDLSLEDMKQNEMLLDSVLFRFIQIAEAAQSLSTSFKSQSASLPWHELYGIRNRIVHAYDIVRADIVYDTIKNDLVPFRNALLNYL
ncbi:MAG: DUF86 domain-containing protein [Spirochaetales bacterium]|nr:DUF86 domain-containing protein [Spirochaetales bacterium]